MNTIPGMIKDTDINQHIYKKHIMILLWSGLSVDEISKKLKLDDTYIYETIADHVRENKGLFKKVK